MRGNLIFKLTRSSMFIGCPLSVVHLSTNSLKHHLNHKMKPDKNFTAMIIGWSPLKVVQRFLINAIFWLQWQPKGKPKHFLVMATKAMNFGMLIHVVVLEEPEKLR